MGSEGKEIILVTFILYLLISYDVKRTQLRSKEINEKLAPYNITLTKKDNAELVEEEDHRIILINKQPAFFYYQEKLVPLLKYLLSNPSLLPTITIDMGAVKFIVNGADVMRPGIVEISQRILKDNFVVIMDQNNKKPLSVGIALYLTEEMKAMTTGKVIKNIHYVGDELWNISNEVDTK